ncbi:hypothetical protein G3I44_00970 [Halogeometricum borinquense]|uniref:Uncharacterized protein n=1 Tax=Halogeometricum borinquense TaxID=60847 RepID=A0A6C0UJ46_9EURY|nr:hypothetical protein [Halogeometricum borinquense]QIB72978.1 hypothetical protein G3I44_00970 [Halogeometricum borinquense]
MYSFPPLSTAPSFVFTVVVGGAIGFLVGLITLLFTSDKTRDTTSGLIPEWGPGYLGFTAGGGAIFAMIRFAVSWPYTNRYFTASTGMTLTFSLRDAITLLVLAYLFSLGYQAAPKDRIQAARLGGLFVFVTLGLCSAVVFGLLVLI